MTRGRDHSKAKRRELRTPSNIVQRLHTRSFSVFITHSPPLFLGPSWMIPTSANSEQTRSTGRWRDTLVASSFSRCSGAIAAKTARAGGASTAAKAITTDGVKVVGNLLWKAEIT